MKRIHAVAGVVLALSVMSFAGCANDADTVEKAAAATMKNRTEQGGASVVVTAINALTYDDADENGVCRIVVPASAVKSVNDIYKIKDAVIAKNAEDSRIKVSLDFSATTFPNNTVVDGMFQNGRSSENPGLVGLVLPNNIEKIENWVIAYSGITKITIPASVKFVSKYAFCDSSVTNVIFANARTKTWYAGAGSPINCYLDDFSPINLDIPATNASNYIHYNMKNVFTQEYIDEQKALFPKFLNSAPQVNVFTNETWDINDGYTVVTGTNENQIYKITTTPRTTYTVYWCDGYNIRNMPNSFTNVPTNLYDVRDLTVRGNNNFDYIYQTDDSVTFTFVAKSDVTYITLTCASGGKCAFRVSK